MKKLLSLIVGSALAALPSYVYAATFNGSVNARIPDSIVTTSVLNVNRQGSLITGGTGCAGDVTGRYTWGADSNVVLNGTPGNAMTVQCGNTPLVTVDANGNVSTNGAIRMAISNLKGYVPPLINGDGTAAGPFSQVRFGQIAVSCTQTATANAFYSCYPAGAGPTFVFGGATFSNASSYKCVATPVGENYGMATFIPLSGSAFRLALLAYDHSPAAVNYVCGGS